MTRVFSQSPAVCQPLQRSKRCTTFVTNLRSEREEVQGPACGVCLGRRRVMVPRVELRGRKETCKRRLRGGYNCLYS